LQDYKEGVMAGGESILEPSVAAKVIAEFTRVSSLVPAARMERLVEPLSERELEILALIARGAATRKSPASYSSPKAQSRTT
jgi:DNA-binding NarL/FixJ family response regulator